MKTFLILLFAVCFESLFAQTAKSNVEISKRFLIHLQKGEYKLAEKYFDTIVSNKMSASKLGDVWEDIQGQMGDFQKCIAINTEKKEGLEIVYQTCKFEYAILDLKLAFNSKNLIVGIFFSPHQPNDQYQLPSYVKQQTVTESKVEVKTGKFVLPGLLTVPIAGEKFPVVILVHGSGPGDKDESVGPNKPFKDLAYGLANKGIAVLRYDKRTKIYGSEFTEQKNTFTVKDEVLDDVSSAIRLVKGIPEIDTNNIYVIGHSLGGMLAPRIAKLNSGLKGIVMMAGPARALEDYILEQTIYLSEGKLSGEEKKEIERIKTDIDKIKHNYLSKNVSDTTNLLGLPASYWIDLNNEQTEIAKKLNCKILVLQGERDYQVPLKDFDTWKQELSGNKNVEFHSYPKLNHLFLEGEGKSLPAEYDKVGNIPEYVINDIATWITGQNFLQVQNKEDLNYKTISDNIVTNYNSQNFRAIFFAFSNAMQEAVPAEKLVPVMEDMYRQYGKINNKELHKIESSGKAIYKINFEHAVTNMQLMLDENNKITGLLFEPPQNTLPAQRNKTDLHLPFKNEWLAFWGGDTKEQNYHVTNRAQQCAFDFVIVNAEGRSFRTDGKENKDYYAYGQEIIAPAGGTVTDVIDGVRDNIPGKMNTYNVTGNSVIIQTENNEYLVFAHFKQGSIKVKVGDKVRTGQLLGLCGNSGHSSEPHLHFHIQDTYDINEAKGIKCYFKEVKVRTNGGKEEIKKDYSPVKDDLVKE